MYCEQCGHDILVDTTNCPYCGEPLRPNGQNINLSTPSVEQATERFSEASDEASTANAQTNFCPFCGTKTVPGGKFCVSCGQTLTTNGEQSETNAQPAQNGAPMSSNYDPYLPNNRQRYGERSNDTAGRTQGILSIVFAFFFPIVGLILGIVAINKGKYNTSNARTLGIIGVVLSAFCWLFNAIFLQQLVDGIIEELPDMQAMIQLFIH